MTAPVRGDGQPGGTTSDDDRRPTIIDLEAHIVTREVLTAWRDVEPEWQDLAFVPSNTPGTRTKLLDLGPGRLDDMDRAGVDVQVLSLSTPGLQNLRPELAAALQTEVNDRLAAAVAANPARLQGFATLATHDGNRAAQELRRAVTELGLDGAMIFGRTRGRSLDHPDFWPIFEAAEALRAPLYLHPQSPPPEVRAAYYDGFGTAAGAAFATHAVGWHYDTGVQILRLILAGVFDRFPGLRLITGHWGELVAFYLERIDHLAAAGLGRRPSEVLRENLYVTPSGMFSERYAEWAEQVLGPDRILFATDYPFVAGPADAARRFLLAATRGRPERSSWAATGWQTLRAGIRR